MDPEVVRGWCVEKETDDTEERSEFAVERGNDVVVQESAATRQHVEASNDEYPVSSHSENQSNESKFIRWKLLAFIILIVAMILAVTIPLVIKTENDTGGNESDVPLPSQHGLSLPPGSTVMSQDLFDLAVELIFISKEAYNEPTQVPGSIRFEDDINAALFVKKDERCIVAFQATRKNVEDWLTNIPIVDPVQFYSATGKTCKTQQGFLKSYYNVSYYNALVQHIKNCTESCKDKCDLVITGGSQGAAIAAVAAVDLDFLQPYLVTFGQPATLFDVENEPPCGDSILPERYTRFVNTVEGTLNALPFFHSNAPALQYDLVAMLPAGYNMTDKLGTLILLGYTTENHFVVYPQGQRELIPPALFGKFDSHVMASYIAKLQAIQDLHGHEQIHLDGFLDGSLCNYDSECQSRSICYNRSCTVATSPAIEELSNKLGRGGLCFRDEDCESNVCVVTCRDENYRYSCSATSPSFDFDECFSLMNLF
jgi:hypothetical protein